MKETTILKKIFIYFSFPFCLLLFLPISCNRRPIDEPVVETIDLDKAVFKDSLFFSEFVKYYKYTEIETNDKSFFSNDSKLVFTDSSIVVVNEKLRKILLFSKLGKFLNKIDRVGVGKGNFLSIQDFDVDKATRKLSIYDIKQHKILTFDLGGNFIDEVNLDITPSRMKVLNNIAYLLLPGKRSQNNNFYSIVGIDLGSHDKGFLLKRSQSFVKDIENSRFFSFKKSDDIIYYWEDFYDYLYSISGVGDKILYSIRFTKNTFTKEELQSDTFFLNNWDKKPHIVDVLPSSKYIFITTCEYRDRFFYIFDISKSKLYKSRYKLFNNIDFGPPFWPTQSDGGNSFSCLLDVFYLKQCNNFLKTTDLELDSLVTKKSLNDNSISFEVNFN